MRIPCPTCGERAHAEFTYLGDASPTRPQGFPQSGNDGAVAADAFVEYVYLRRNPPGGLREWWQHTGGCRAWLAVERDVTTHAVGTVTAARDVVEVGR